MVSWLKSGHLSRGRGEFAVAFRSPHAVGTSTRTRTGTTLDLGPKGDPTDRGATCQMTESRNEAAARDTDVHLVRKERVDACPTLASTFVHALSSSLATMGHVSILCEYSRVTSTATNLDSR